MKKQYEFTFRAEENDNNLNLIKELLETTKKQYGDYPNVNFTEIISMTSLYYYFSITFYNDTEIRDFIIQNAQIKGFEETESKIKGLTYGYTVFSEYSKEEEDRAEYFVVIQLTSDKNSKGYKKDSGKYLDEIYGTSFEYNESSCRTCSFGRIQTSNLHINYNHLKKSNIFRFGTHILLKENLKNKFYTQNFTGIEYQPVNDYKNREMYSKYYQIIVTNTLSRMSDETKISNITNGNCKTCNNEINLLRTGIIYDRVNLNSALDFNKTSEILGGKQENYWVISKKVKDFLDTLAEKEDIFYEPIEIIE